jgi:hypothetical protein
MRKWRFGVAAALTLAMVPAFVLLHAPQASSQQTPQAQPTWTPSPECQRIETLFEARQKAGQSLTRGEYSTFEGCNIEAEGHAPPVRYRPEWGPLMTPPYVIRRVLPPPAPSP